MKKLLAGFLFPPGIFVLLFLAAAVLVRRFRIFFLSAAILFYLISTPYVGTRLITPLEQRYTLPDPIPSDIDAVIVLSGGNNLGVPNLPLMPGSFKRLLYGIMLAKRYDLPLIFSGGFRESDAATQCIQELNDTIGLDLPHPRHFTPHFSIYFESRSRDTYENARYTKAMLRAFGLHDPKILLVTSAFHMPRAMLLFTKAGLHALPAPTDYKASSLRHLWYLPSVTGLRLSYFALHEYAGYLRYALGN